MKGTALSNCSKQVMLLLLLVIVPATRVFCQPPPSVRSDFELIFDGRVVEFDDKKQKDVPLPDCSITLYKGNVVHSNTSTQANGKFKLTVPHDGDFVVQITKPGYITKRIAINTFNVPDERTNGPFANYDVEVDLFKIFPGLDYSVLNKPIARIIYNPLPAVEDFDYDKVYTSQIQAELDRLKELARQAREKLKLYQAAIDAADKLFNASDWTNARAKYQEALGILPNEQYPKDQIAKCDAKLGANAAEKKKYDDAMAAGEAFFTAKNYSSAKAKFQEAQAVRPTELLPPQRIKACDDALAGAAKEKQYADAIADADAKFAAKDYAGAKVKYQEAAGLKPAEAYPPMRIKACDDAIAAAAKDKQYNDAIADADAKFAAKDYTGARAKYVTAGTIKPAEAYPPMRIKACDDAIGAAAKDKLYADAIADADKKFDAKDFTNARSKYVEASGMKPAEQYPKDKIKACDDALAGAAKDKAYADAIKDADTKFAAKDFPGARSKYVEASGMKPAEQYPKDKIKACDDAMAGAAKDKAYADAIKDADAKFLAKDFTNARAKYVEASGIKPTEQYPKDRIKACDDAMGAAAKDKAYTDAIAAADAKFTSKDFPNAKSKYQEASGIKPSEQYPKDRIKACDDAINAAAKEKVYADLIAAADAKFAAKDYLAARTKYAEASALKPSEQYPKDRIKACDDAMAAAGLEKQYADLIKQADTKFSTKDYSGAKTIYQQASDLKSSEQYPKDRIKACDDAMGAAAIDAQYKELIKNADTKFTAKDYAGAKDIYVQASNVKPTEQYPKDRIKSCDDFLGKDKAYADAIADADKKFTAKDFSNAKTKYQEASGLKPAEQYPKDRIKACDDAINAAAKDKLYTDAIADADAKFNAKDFSNARSKYAEASGIKPTEQYPKDRMKLCDDQMGAAAKEKAYTDAIAAADVKFAAKDWAGAKAKYQEASGLKPNEKYPKDQIKLCDDGIAAAAIEKQYADLIKSADAKFNAKAYADAKTIYQQASSMKSSEQYPKDRIKACDDALGAAALDKQYADLIKQADTKYSAKDYSGAKEIYVQASNVKPAEQYPKDRIKSCDDFLGKDKAYADAIADADKKFAAKDYTNAKTKYQEALSLKSSEQYPKDKIKACDDALNAAAKDKLYADAIADADAKYIAKDFTNARSKYAEASGMKPAEQYPKDRMKLCDEQMGAAAKEKAYKDAIAAADAKFDGKDWNAAKAKYTEASGLKPNEQYPKDRIKACEDAIAAAGKEKQYADLIKTADVKFNAKDYPGAKSIYQQASTLKSSEQYPKDQIKACDDAMGAVAIDAQYKALIATADGLFTSKNWTGAKTKYQEALGVKPAESYPKERIKICDENINASLDLEAKYKKLIIRGDSAFGVNDLETAQSAFLAAKDLKPSEPYPPQKLAEIAKLLSASTKDKAYRALIVQGDSLFRVKDYDGAKKNFTQATKDKPDDQYPKDKLTEIKRIQDDIKFDAAKQKRYDQLMAQADKKFAAKDYKGAKDYYNQALLEKPMEVLPKTQILKCDELLNPKTVVTTNPTDPTVHDQYISDIVKKYPQGLTEQQTTESGTTTVVRVVVVGNKGWIYKKTVYNWGTFYFKDGVQISEQTFNVETALTYVQQQQAEYDKNHK